MSIVFLYQHLVGFADVFDEEDAKKDDEDVEKEVADIFEGMVEEIVDESVEPSVGADEVVETAVSDDAVLPVDPDVDDLVTAKRRKFEQEAREGREKTTGKQRRKMERKQRDIKIGGNFYEKVDVKNRNRSKKEKNKFESKRKHQKRV